MGQFRSTVTDGGHYDSPLSESGTYLAMGATAGFIEASCGYVGASGGWQDLKDNLKLDWDYERADEGNVAVVGQIDLPSAPNFNPQKALRSIIRISDRIV